MTELSHLKREQMVRNNNYQNMQFGLEQRKVELLEQESTIKMEKLKQKKLESIYILLRSKCS